MSRICSSRLAPARSAGAPGGAPVYRSSGVPERVPGAPGSITRYVGIPLRRFSCRRKRIEQTRSDLPAPIPRNHRGGARRLRAHRHRVRRCPRRHAARAHSQRHRERRPGLLAEHRRPLDHGRDFAEAHQLQAGRQVGVGALLRGVDRSGRREDHQLQGPPRLPVERRLRRAERRGRPVLLRALSRHRARRAQRRKLGAAQPRRRARSLQRHHRLQGALLRRMVVRSPLRDRLDRLQEGGRGRGGHLLARAAGAGRPLQDGGARPEPVDRARIPIPAGTARSPTSSGSSSIPSPTPRRRRTPSRPDSSTSSGSA